MQDETDAISQHVNASSSTHHSIKKPSQSDEICYNNNEVRSAVHPSQSASNSTVSHEGQSDTSNVESGTSVAQTNNSLSEEVNDNNELSSPLRTSPTQDSESLYKEIRLAYTRTMSVDDGETREKQNSRTSFHRASFNRSISEGTPSSIKSEPPTEAEATAAPSRDEGDGGGRARRRWRLVLNVKKLDNIHTQMLTRSNIDKPSATPPPASSNPEQNTPPTRNKFVSIFVRLRCLVKRHRRWACVAIIDQDMREDFQEWYKCKINVNVQYNLCVFSLRCIQLFYNVLTFGNIWK